MKWVDRIKVIWKKMKRHIDTEGVRRKSRNKLKLFGLLLNIQKTKRKKWCICQSWCLACADSEKLNLVRNHLQNQQFLILQHWASLKVWNLSLHVWFILCKVALMSSFFLFAGYWFAVIWGYGIPHQWSFTSHWFMCWIPSFSHSIFCCQVNALSSTQLDLMAKTLPKFVIIQSNLNIKYLHLLRRNVRGT